jgi:pantoate--beta-alanine ligase
MKVYSSIEDISNAIIAEKKANKTVGFVPTMGALHNGHVSLLDIACKENDIIVVSIFVNPLQFNEKSDFDKYPRDLEADISILSEYKVDYIFAPNYDDIYDGYTLKTFNLAHLNDILEGVHRPGHFNGVANVVYRLFTIVQPDKAYFGKKDYQQIYVIKKMTEDNHLSIDVVECPIIRESDGLAMSSRNKLLGQQYREKVSIISKSLFYINDHFIEKPIEEWKKYINDVFQGEMILQLEYFEFIDLEGFKIITNPTHSKNIIACIAVHAGNVRLIDNININL